MDVRSHGPAELAEVVGLVAQEPETQVISTTVRAEIELPLELRGVSPGARSRAVEEVALALAIDGLLERTTDTLSGGELQRVALAAALAIRPRLVLLDEPTSQLDPVAGDELISLLRRLNEEWGVAVLLGRASAGALPGGGRPRARPGGRGDRLRRRSRETSSPGRSSHDRALTTPGARLLDAIGLPAPSSVREARRTLAERACDRPGAGPPDGPDGRSEHRRAGGDRSRSAPGRLGRARRGRGAHRGPPGRRAARSSRGERVALMGSNGAGKSTLLRAAAGLVEPRRGRIDAPARGRPAAPAARATCSSTSASVTSCAGEDGPEALRRFGLEGMTDSDPRDLSGGERQRLALAIVVAGRDTGDGRAAGGAAARRADPGHGPGPEGRSSPSSGASSRMAGPR